MNIDNFLQIVMCASSALMVVTVLLQQRGASLGAGFGSSGELFTTRRGIDKSLFNATVILATIFVVSIIVALIMPTSN